jgi:hypothetical protein
MVGHERDAARCPGDEALIYLPFDVVFGTRLVKYKNEQDIAVVHTRSS